MAHSAEAAMHTDPIFMRVHVRMTQTLYVKDIKIHWLGSADYRSTYIKFRKGLFGEVVNNNAYNVLDINKGYGGKFVYLEPVLTANAHHALEKIRVVIYNHSHNYGPDMAKGAGGKYRYLWLRDPGCGKIVDVTLWEARLSRVPEGWSGMTGDINKGHGGRDLHIVWKSVECNEN